MYETLDAAMETAAMSPKLGGFVARIELVPDQGITIARWGAETHMTVWAEPAALRALVADVLPVRK
jgi:hypothetical protein